MKNIKNIKNIKLKTLPVLALIIASNIVIADTTMRITIPQPDFISNDWDGDNIPNNEDNDIDNDGTPNEEDSNPYTHTGQSSYVAPDCQGYYPGEFDDRDNHKYLSRVELPSNGGFEYAIVWRDAGVQEGWMPSNGNTIEPLNESTSYLNNGYKYWIDSSNEVVGSETNFTPMGPYIHTLYKVCRVEA